MYQSIARGGKKKIEATNILSAYLTANISFPNVFLTLQSRGHWLTRTGVLNFTVVAYKSTRKESYGNKDQQGNKKKQVNSDQLSQMERKQSNIVINVVYYQFHVTHGGWENYLEKCEGLNLDSWWLFQLGPTPLRQEFDLGTIYGFSMNEWLVCAVWMSCYVLYL